MKANRSFVQISSRMVIWSSDYDLRIFGFTLALCFCVCLYFGNSVYHGSEITNTPNHANDFAQINQGKSRKLARLIEFLFTFTLCPFLVLCKISIRFLPTTKLIYIGNRCFQLYRNQIRFPHTFSNFQWHDLQRHVLLAWVFFIFVRINGNRLLYFPESRFGVRGKALFKNAQAKYFQFHCMPHVHRGYGSEWMNSEINGKHD